MGKHFPCVLQNESHPYLHELDMRNFCAINKIAFQAYSALGSSDRPWRHFGSIVSGAPKLGHEILEHPDILKIAEKYGKSAANVVIRWHLQKGGTLVAKSTNPGRIEANYKVWDFELTADEMSFFEELNVGWQHLITQTSPSKMSFLTITFLENLTRSFSSALNFLVLLKIARFFLTSKNCYLGTI